MLKHPWFQRRSFGTNPLLVDTRIHFFRKLVLGLGWRPVSWQGWLITLIFTIAIFRNFLRIDEDSRSVSDTLINFIPQTIGILFILALICWLTSSKQQPPPDLK